MMRLRLMKEWFACVDAERRSPIAEQLVTPWFAPEAQVIVRCGRASSNIVCRVQAGGQTFYLRCNHASERRAAAYAAEMAFVQHLAAAGVRLARPVPSRTGALVAQVPTPLGPFHAVLLEEAVGVERDLLALDEASLQEWGRTLAGLHAAAHGYEGHGRPSWREHLAFAQGVIPEVEAAAQHELAVVIQALSALPADATCFGLIHFDLEADNMRWHGGVPTLFDFDDCAQYWFVADVAYALRALYADRIERIDLTDPRLCAVVAGYRAVRPLPERDLRLLPLLLRAHNLYWFARLHRAVAEGRMPDEPPWTTELRATLLRTMNGFRAGFARYPVQPYLP